MTDSHTPRSTNRTWMIIAGVIAAIIVAVLVAVSASGGNNSGGDIQLAGVDDAVALFDGVPQAGLVIGKADAKVTIREYFDLQCPFCAAAAKGTTPGLIAQFVKPGRAKLELHPTDLVGGPDSMLGARAVIAAGEQGKAAEFTEILFTNQGQEGAGWLNDGIITKTASELGLDIGKLDDSRGNAASEDAVKKVNDDMSQNGYTSTPTYVVVGPNGTQRIDNYQNLGEFATAIAAVS